MTRLHPYLLALIWILGSWTLAAQEQARFLSIRQVVSVPVSVQERNRPVADLRAAEFRLSDNAVLQQIDDVTFDTVPIDLTLFIDNSGSTTRLHERLNEDLAALVTLLSPADRVRVLAFEWGLKDLVGWVTPGNGVTVGHLGMSRGSPVYDAMFAALSHRPEPGRRHLVIALTDGIDFGSIVSSARVVDVAKRSDAVVHLVMFSQAPDMESVRRRPSPILVAPPDADGQERLRQVARDSGGANFVARGNTRDRFAEILDDFRHSYVLHYSPVGVAATGWHDLKVEIVRQGRFAVRSRRGYLTDKFTAKR